MITSFYGNKQRDFYLKVLHGNGSFAVLIPNLQQSVTKIEPTNVLIKTRILRNVTYQHYVSCHIYIHTHTHTHTHTHKTVVNTR